MRRTRCPPAPSRRRPARRRGLQPGQRQRRARREQDGAGAQHPLGGPGPQGEGGHGPGPAQQRDDQAADEVVAQAEQAGRDRGSEGQVEAAERPAGHQDRDQGVDIGTQPGRDAEPGRERGQAARTARRGLRHPGDDDARQAHAEEQQREDEVRRGRRVLDQGAAAERSQRQAANRRDAVDHAGPAR